MTTGERQASRIRTLYLRAVLRQDVAYFGEPAAPPGRRGRPSGNASVSKSTELSSRISIEMSYDGSFTFKHTEVLLS